MLAAMSVRPWKRPEQAADFRDAAISILSFLYFSIAISICCRIDLAYLPQRIHSFTHMNSSGKCSGIALSASALPYLG